MGCQLNLKMMIYMMIYRTYDKVRPKQNNCSSKLLQLSGKEVLGGQEEEMSIITGRLCLTPGV